MKNPKKAEKRLDFPVTACKLSFGIAFLFVRNTVSSSFQSYFSKSICKPAKFQISSFAPKYGNTSRTIVSSCLAGRFSVRLWSRFLAGPTYARTGKRPAFFVFGCRHFQHDRLRFSSDAASYAGTLSPRPPCFCPYVPTTIKFFYPVSCSSGASAYSLNNIEHDYLLIKDTLQNPSFHKTSSTNERKMNCPSYNSPPTQQYSQPSQQYAQPMWQGTVPPVIESEMDRNTFALLGFLIGGLGIHQFYIGKIGKGIATILANIICSPLVYLIVGIDLLTTTSDSQKRPLKDKDSPVAISLGVLMILGGIILFVIYVQHYIKTRNILSLQQ